MSPGSAEDSPFALYIFALQVNHRLAKAEIILYREPSKNTVSVRDLVVNPYGVLVVISNRSGRPNKVVQLARQILLGQLKIN